MPNINNKQKERGADIPLHIQGDQKVSVHLMITIQEVISNVQNAPRQSPDS
jgi:hypothetical protein